MNLVRVSRIDTTNVCLDVTAPGVPVELAPSLTVVLTRDEAVELRNALTDLVTETVAVRPHEFARR